MVDEATKLERKVAAHAHGTEGIKIAVRAGVASIEHGSFLDEEGARMMAQHGTFLVPTLSAGEAVEQRREGRRPQGPSRREGPRRRGGDAERRQDRRARTACRSRSAPTPASARTARTATSSR